MLHTSPCGPETVPARSSERAPPSRSDPGGENLEEDRCVIELSFASNRQETGRASPWRRERTTRSGACDCGRFDKRRPHGLLATLPGHLKRFSSRQDESPSAKRV